MKKIVVVILLTLLFKSISFGQSGNWLWAKQATGSGTQEGICGAIDANGNVYSTGFFGNSNITFDTITLTNAGGSGIYDMFIEKVDNNGNVLWAKSAGGTGDDRGYSITTDVFGNVYVTGYFKSPTIVFDTITLTNSGSADVFTVKYDTNGNVLWAKRAGGSNLDFANSITTDGSGNVIVTGVFLSNSISFGSTTLTNPFVSGMFIVKYSSSGTVIWAKKPQGTSYGNDNGNYIITDISGNIYITGYFTSTTLTFDTISISAVTGNEMFIVKYSPTGSALWASRVGGFLNDSGNSIALDTAGNVYVIGTFSSPVIVFGSTSLTNASPTSTDDIFILKYNSNGGKIWAKSMGGYKEDNGFSIASYSTGFYITGSFLSDSIILGTQKLFPPTGSVDPMFIAKYDFNGNEICAAALASGGDDYSSIVIDNLDNVYLIGDFETNPFIVGLDTLLQVGTENYFIAKYSCIGIPVSVNELAHPEIASLYPNPATSSFTITMAEGKLKEVKLFNILGNEILRQVQNEQTANIDISGYAKGIYFIQITDEKKNVVNRKVVVE